MSILDTFFILFDADTSKVDKGVKESEKGAQGLIETLQKTDAQAATLGDTFLTMAKKGAGLLGLGLSVTALARGVASTAAEYVALEKLAAQFRSTAEAIDEFQDAGQLLGLSNEDTTGGLKALEATMQDTMLGLGRAKKVYEELGLEVTDAGGKVKSTTDFMGELAGKFKELDRGTQIRVMERLGLNPALLKVFNSDMIDLQKRMAAVDAAAGFSMEKALKRSAEYTKASKAALLEVKTLTLYLEKLKDVMLLNAAPVFTLALEKATAVLKTFVEFVLRNQRFVEGVFIAIGSAILYFLVPAAVSGAVAMWAMIAPFLLAGAIVVAVAGAFALLYDDIMNFIDGNDSLIGQIMAGTSVAGAALRGLVEAFRWVLDAAREVWAFMGLMWAEPGAAFDMFARNVAAGLDAMLTKFPPLRFAAEAIAAVFKVAGIVIEGAFNSVLAIVQFTVSAFLAGLNALRAGVDAFHSFFGAKTTTTGASIFAGQQQLADVSASPLSSVTSSSINNRRGGDRNTSVQIGSIPIQTQATDAAGISRAIGGALDSQMRQAASNYDDGVLV